GAFGGDRLTVAAVLEEGAHAHLTSQSATKLYGGTRLECVQDLRFDVGAGADLEHVPDAPLPPPRARFRHRTATALAPAGVFVGAETLAPGRHGERFAYDRIDLRTEARCEGRELCADVLRLEPGRRSPAAPALLGPWTHVSTLLAVAPGRDA